MAETTGSTSLIDMNPQYAFTVQGAVKVSQTAVNLVCLIIIAICGNGSPTQTFFLIMASFCFMATALIVISSFLSKEFAETINISIYEYLYNGTVAVLLLCCSIAILCTAGHPSSKTAAIIIAGIFGLVDTVLYSASFGLAVKFKMSS